MRSARDNVVAAQRRFAARRRRRHHRRLRLAVAAALAVTALAVGGWLVANSSLVDLRTVTVEGTSRLTPAAVVRAADVQHGQSLFRLDLTAVAHRVERLPAVASAAVARRWPHRLVIRVTERTPVAVVDGTDGPVLLDRTGMAFAREPTPPPGLVHVQVDGMVSVSGAAGGGSGNDEARAAVRVLAALPAAVRHRVDAVRAPTPESVTLQLHGGQTVIWGSPAGSDTKASVLRVLLRRPARVYDVSAPTVAATR